MQKRIEFKRLIKKYLIGSFNYLVIGLLGYLFIGLFIYSPVHAQTLGLTITPPINEIMIVPGKSITQTYTITNDGLDGMASIYIIPFRAQGENGNVFLDETNAVTSTSTFASWFSLVSPVNTFGEKFFVGGGSHQDFTIKISPPESAAEKDYYFTILYELSSNTSGNVDVQGPVSQARIGTNLLISLSKNESVKQDLNIVEFSAPKIIDSLQGINFNIRIGNFGSYVFKPQGKITIKPLIGSSETLTLAPYNIITDSIRNIPCKKDDDIGLCKSNRKVLIGIYKSTIEVSPDGNGQTKEKTITTIAFPFSILSAITLIIITYGIIKRRYTLQKKSPEFDNKS